MSEQALRWKGRLGELKYGALPLALLLAIALILVIAGPLATARKNPGGPTQVTLSQLLDKTVGTGRHVTVSGTAIYAAGISESEDGRLVAFYYPVASWDEGAVVYVRSAQAREDAVKSENEDVTVTGLVGKTEQALRVYIERDVAAIEEAGLTTDPAVVLNQGRKPGSVSGLSTAAALIGLAIALCLATLLFPHPVFGAHPVEQGVAPLDYDRALWAAGRFEQLKSVDPQVVVGKRTRMMRAAVANYVTLEDGRPMIYVREVVKTQAGITVSTTHWGRFLQPKRVRVVEPGKVYSWKVRPALRLHSVDMKGRSDDLILSFSHSAAQAELLELLREQGFAVAAGA
ncbi:MAG: hypothetical protein GX557_03875 [Chloroflexi bacterium]|nr:hypothetical protein [Chloroflexota bacterium]